VNNMQLDTGTGKDRRRLTLEEAMAGYQPTLMTKEEWHDMHMLSQRLSNPQIKEKEDEC
jgi:hypothetical protein